MENHVKRRIETISSQLSLKREETSSKTSDNKKNKVFEDPNADLTPLDANNLFGLNGKICLVTGATKGIGKMIASGFVANGAHVFITSRSADLCDSVAESLTSQYKAKSGGSAESLPGDLSSLSGVEKLVEELTKRLRGRKLNVLVNNAGKTWGASLEDFPDSAWQSVMDLNVRHVFNLTKLCLPLMKSKLGEGDSARVIMISSVDGIRGIQTFGPTAAFSYSASKAALIHLTKTLSRALAEHNITVNCIAPGVFPSNMTKFMLSSDAGQSVAANQNPIKRLGRTSDMAATALYLAGPGGAFTNGSIVIVDGGAHLFY